MSYFTVYMPVIITKNAIVTLSKKNICVKVNCCFHIVINWLYDINNIMEISSYPLHQTGMKTVSL